MKFVFCTFSVKSCSVPPTPRCEPNPRQPHLRAPRISSGGFPYNCRNEIRYTCDPGCDLIGNDRPITCRPSVTSCQEPQWDGTPPCCNCPRKIFFFISSPSNCFYEFMNLKRNVCASRSVHVVGEEYDHCNPKT